MQKYPFKMTANDGQALELMKHARLSGMGLIGAEALPFTFEWKDRGRLERVDNAHLSRFDLPSLQFHGQEIARLGFRNKDGFILIRDGLDEEVMRACTSRYKAMISDAKRLRLEYVREMESLRAEAEVVMFGDHLETERPSPHRGMPDISGSVLIHGAHCLLSRMPRVSLSTQLAEDGFVKSITAHLRSGTSGCTLHLLTISRDLQRGATTVNRNRVVVNVHYPFLGTTPFAAESARRNQKDRIFKERCAEAHAAEAAKTAGVQTVPKEFAVSDLMQAVRSTDFGYM